MRAPLNVLPEPGGPWIGKIDGSLHNDATKPLLSFVSVRPSLCSRWELSALGFRVKQISCGLEGAFRAMLFSPTQMPIREGSVVSLRADENRRDTNALGAELPN